MSTDLKEVLVSEAPQPLHVILVLDESSSMEPAKSEIVQSINVFIKDQQELKDEAYFTLLKFSSTCSYVVVKQLMTQTQALEPSAYKPNGMTALFSAVAKVCLDFKSETRVLLCVVTDGEENSSKDYTRKQVEQLLSERKESGWKTIFLAATLDVATGGDNVGFGAVGGVSSQDRVLTTGMCNVVVGYAAMGKNISVAVNEAVQGMRKKRSTTRQEQEDGDMGELDSLNFSIG